jgi:hypothetical protein
MIGRGIVDLDALAVHEFQHWDPCGGWTRSGSWVEFGIGSVPIGQSWAWSWCSPKGRADGRVLPKIDVLELWEQNNRAQEIIE